MNQHDATVYRREDLHGVFIVETLTANNQTILFKCGPCHPERTSPYTDDKVSLFTIDMENQSTTEGSSFRATIEGSCRRENFQTKEMTFDEIIIGKQLVLTIYTRIMQSGMQSVYGPQETRYTASIQSVKILSDRV